MRGQHRKQNGFVAIAHSKPAMYALVVLVLGGGALYLSKTSYAANTPGTGVYVGTPGTYDSSGVIQGGSTLALQPNSAQPQGYLQSANNALFSFAKDYVVINNNGNLIDTNLLHLDETQRGGVKISSDNGYLYTSESSSNGSEDEITDWGTELNANASYLQNLYQSGQLEQAVYMVKGTNQGERLVDLSDLVQESGAAFEDGNYIKYGKDYGYHYIMATQPPQAQLVIPKTTVNPGGTLKWYDEAALQSYNETGFHLEYVQVKDSNGQDVTSQWEQGMNGGGTVGGTENLVGNPGYATTHQQAPYSGGPQMTAVMGGGTTSTTLKPTWETWADSTNIGSSQSSPQFIDNPWASVRPNQVKVPSDASGKYTMTLFVSDWYGRVAQASATFTVSGTPQGGGNPSPPPPPPPGNSGLCPAPYDSSEAWSSDGNGAETLSWVYNVPTPQYRNTKNGPVFVGCKDITTPMSHTYNWTLNQGQITGLSYDPGTPSLMYLPTSNAESWAVQANGKSFWKSLLSSHGWDGFENSSPTASQVSGTYTINGVGGYHTYGPGEGSKPWAWSRPGAGFGWRMRWTGSPHSLPTSGTVTFTMRNPDGTTRTWKEKLIVNSDTLITQGSSLIGLNEPPPPASEYISAWTQVPKHTTSGVQPELAAWSVSGNTATAFNEGAHISATITIVTQHAGNITQTEDNIIALYSFPAWFFNQIKSTTVAGQTYSNQ
ncbi:hypothetical protein [Alicyclobacillus ferrooxydans]|uniref:Uncharacterized protein n=1 Tax=Alicyclobacillus ferrooxydans TaxID=471514 RepID=A0A0P9EPR3_9BACL|nr:hypothetical protein [Alicyclobacillus ferrooxydans]KPV45490.1 hypothetical protein AN477_00570 [Alicyclobacillus ferrooxydans]